MRIRPPPAQSSSRGAPGARVHAWLRLHRSVSFLSVIVLCAAFAIVAWIWYESEKYEVVVPFLRRSFPEAIVRTNDLPILVFDIETEAYRALSAQRAEALRRGMGLPDEEGWHPAQVHLQGARIQVRIKLAGNNADHWREGKWSLQVQIQDGPTLLGMQSFVLQSPATCGYLNSWLYSQDLRHAGILVPQPLIV